MMSTEDKKTVRLLVEKLKNREIPPWKVEDEIIDHRQAESPRQFRLAALARRRYLEEETGEIFHSITVPEMPYKLLYRCEKENLGYELDARAEVHIPVEEFENFFSLSVDKFLAAQVLAGEFNLALEIALERLYRPQ